MTTGPHTEPVVGRRTIRAKVLAGLGGVCAWCGSPGPLEIDHIEGGGNQHRRRLGSLKLHTWLWREYQAHGVWPVGYELLCKSCHDRKSNRMPPREGNKQLNVHLPDELAMQLTALAAQHDGSKSRVVELALRAHLEGTFLHSATDGLHQALASAHTKVQRDLEALTHQMVMLCSLVQGLDNRLRALEERDDKRYGSLLEAFDRLKSRETHGEKSRLWSFAQGQR